MKIKNFYLKKSLKDTGGLFLCMKVKELIWQMNVWIQ